MKYGLKIGISLLAVLGCAACETTSGTEDDFGNSVRNMIANQAMEPQGPLAADEALTSGDGRRQSNVNTVYQTKVGDPSPVVRQVEVKQGEGQQ
jgi:hypothetical protein